MDLKIKGKKALVMGGSTGLGFGIAKALAEEGVDVAICSRNQQNLEKAKSQIGAKAIFDIDLSTPGSGREAVKKAISLLGGIDILVTNNGGPPKGAFMSLETDSWQKGFESLYLTVTESMREAILCMQKKQWGRILLVTSAAAKEPIAGLTVSNGLRAGLLGLTNTVSQEVASSGITINALLPGYTDTERLRELGVAYEKIEAQIPAKRLGKPSEFGSLAAYLCSEQAAYITGQAIAVDGGYLRGI